MLLGVGLEDPFESLPTGGIPWFSDYR